MPALFHGYGAVDISSCTALAVAQGLTVVLPRRPRRVALRIPHTWAAILPPAAFLATVAGLAMHPSLALAVVAVACVGVPVLGALAIAAFARGGRPARALLVVPLLVARRPARRRRRRARRADARDAELRGARVAAGGRAGVRELVIAALLVAVLDLVLMHAGGIRIATAALLDAHARAHARLRPAGAGAHDDRLRRLLRGRAGRRHRSAPAVAQTLVALATTAFALAQYALSSDGDLLPATAPVAVAMVVAAVAARLRRRRAQVAAAPAI